VAAAVLIVGISWWSSDSPRERPVPPPGAIATDVWVPYWTLDAVTLDGTDRLDVVREISPFWFETLGIDEIGVVDQAQPDQIDAFLDSVDRAYIVPSLSDHMPAGGMAAIIADPVQRRRHVEAIIEFAEEHDAVGIDLDYEQFAFADGSDTW